MYSADIKRNVNPREKASFLNILWFIYPWTVLKIGIKRDLNENDVFEVMKRFRSETVTNKLEKHWDNELKKTKQSLLRALWGAFGIEYVCLVLFAGVYRFSYMIIGPIAISKIVGYFVEGQTKISKQDAYYYGALLFITKLAYSLLSHHFLLLLDQLSIKIKTSLCSIVYRKSLRFNELTTHNISAGYIMTIIAKDVEIFDVIVQNIHDVGIGFIELLIICYITYNSIGGATFIGIGFLVAFLPISFYVATLIANRRFRVSARSDERLSIMQEIFATIKLIKMYTWDRFFTNLGSEARRKEMKMLRQLKTLKALTVSLGITNAMFSVYLCLISYIYMNNNLTAEQAYLIINCYEVSKEVLGMAIPENVNRFGEARSCLGRIEKLLLSNQISTKTNDCSNGIQKTTSINLKNIDVKLDGNKLLLNDVNFNLENGLIGVTGPVGCGKSILLKTILNDVRVSRGEVNTTGNFSYASQEPWIFPGTIRQNILFGQEFDGKRYKNVVKICALERDINNWTNGDKFLVIDRGLNISRGQQARVNLARTIYRDADIYLLDDSLSSLDSIVSEHIFNACIAEFLANKLVILVTHDTKFLENCTNILYMKDGSVALRGTITDLQKVGVDFGDSFEYRSNKKVGNKKNHRADKSPESEFIETTEESILLGNTIDTTQIYQENQKKGKVDGSIYKLYFALMGGWKYMLPLSIVFAARQFSYAYWNYFVSEWVDIEQNRTNYIERNQTDTAEYEALQPSILFARTFSAVIATSAMILNIILCFSFHAMTTGAARRIHNKSFRRIMEATMNFFDNILPGTVLNRFSKDFTIVDEWIPNSVFDVASVIGALVGTISNVILSNVLFLFPTLIIGTVMYFARHYYIRTGRCLHRLTGITRAPVVGHLNASLNGLTTIRASRNQDILKYQFDRHQDLYTSAVYMQITTFRSFLYYMECLCNMYICFVIFTFLGISTDTLPGKVGLGISQSLAMSSVLQWAIRQSSNLEVCMTSCERVLEYTSLKQEDSSGKLISNWPSEGKLEYINVSMCYTTSEEPVLKDISFLVNPKEKIGIIGRTGAGKSSILSALFRLYRISGKITIDDIDINEMDLIEMRSKISIIPQDPVLYAGTLRSNLDPYQLYKDDQIWQALKEVDLTSIESLDCAIQRGGSNFSIGQRQLICLARVILKSNRILVLDEATANVDPHTNELMQKTIQRVFADCTMLIIAHRLSTVMTCDKIMVVDSGAIVEFGTPEELLKNENGVFHDLAVNTEFHLKSN